MSLQLNGSQGIDYSPPRTKVRVQTDQDSDVSIGTRGHHLRPWEGTWEGPPRVPRKTKNLRKNRTGERGKEREEKDEKRREREKGDPSFLSYLPSFSSSLLFLLWKEGKKGRRKEGNSIWYVFHVFIIDMSSPLKIYINMGILLVGPVLSLVKEVGLWRKHG